MDANNNLYIIDPSSHRVRVLTSLDTSAKINTVVGVTHPGSTSYPSGNGADNASATAVQLNNPWGLTISSDGRFVVSDSGNSVVRETAP
jgi:hypothetical protein